MRTSLAVQWLRRHTSNEEGKGSIPGWEIKIPHGMQCDQKITQNTHRQKYIF